MTGYEWRDHAACVGKTALFFGEARSACGQEMYSVARRICASCPVLEDCREFALKEPFLHGFLGGMSPREREAIRRKRRVA